MQKPEQTKQTEQTVEKENSRQKRQKRRELGNAQHASGLPRANQSLPTIGNGLADVRHDERLAVEASGGNASLRAAASVLHTSTTSRESVCCGVALPSLWPAREENSATPETWVK